MAEPAVKKNHALSSPAAKTSGGTKELHKTLSQRQSQELVIALCGPIGCGIDKVKDQLCQVLESEDYKVFDIRVSRLIEKYYAEILKHPLQYNTQSRSARYNALMDAGNELRQEHGGTICADLATTHISELRQISGKDGRDGEAILTDKKVALEKRAYIIDQLKHPEEVTALKSIYGSLCYLIGVLSDNARRERTLVQIEGIDRSEAHGLIMRDQGEASGHGQHLEDTLFHADFFINNTNPNSAATNNQFTRFLKLIHGGHGVTPTQEEYGMYTAYSASVQSACMSRQVGAAIIDNKGNLLSIGRNDVPKFGGGLYTEDDFTAPNTSDFRCVHKDQQCHNDLHKEKLRKTIREILAAELEELRSKLELLKLPEGIDLPCPDTLATRIVKNSPIKSLIEYSRAIHAEMDAIIAIVRSGKDIPPKSTIYTTTFPCHNCARHIVASGLEKVVYIEPYEKSLALALHEDSLTLDAAINKVQLTPFQGVAPSRYQVFFSNTSPEKGADGKMIITDSADRLHVDAEFVDSYVQRELKVAGEILGRKAAD